MEEVGGAARVKDSGGLVDLIMRLTVSEVDGPSSELTAGGSTTGI